jgi:hypothetical protein
MTRRVFNWVEHVESDSTRKPDLYTFTYLRLFHGCRLLSVESYHEQGVLVMPLAELERQFREIFSDFSTEVLQHVAGKITRRDDEWRVDAALDLRFLLKHASHFIVQGSEPLKVFAAHLPVIGDEDPRERLKNAGVPTAFVIDAPLDEVDDRALEELDEKLSILAKKGGYEVCYDGDMIDFTVSFAKGVPSEWLSRHETIREATDPADHSRKYYFYE